MVSKRLLKRFLLVVTLILVAMGVSACYKNAGDDMEPTSNRVDLSDIAPTTPATPTPMPTVLPTEQLAVTATRTLVPTTTPADFVPPTAEPTTDSQQVEVVPPTNTAPFAPSFTPAATPTPSEPGIATPGMSDIQPSPTPPPTIDPRFQPTPTDIPVEENPCIHVVQPNDTLYSISQDAGVLLTELVAANPEYLGGSANTPLQISWQLKIPGCVPPGMEITPTAAVGEGEVTPTPASVQAGSPTTHVVQAGETIYAIGRQYGVSAEAIIAANNLANPNLIQPGDTLIIPAPQ